MAKNLIEKITEKQLNPNVPEFRVGDTVIEGVVVARKGTGVSETFTVRKEVSGIGVERIFPVNSPNIASITVTKKGKVRRAKLYFLRDRKKAYKIKERR